MFNDWLSGWESGSLICRFAIFHGVNASTVVIAESGVGKMCANSSQGSLELGSGHCCDTFWHMSMRHKEACSLKIIGSRTNLKRSKHPSVNK